MKISIEEIVSSLKKNKVADDTIKKVVEDISDIAESNSTPTVSHPKSKKQYVVVVSDPEGKLKNVDLVGWVTQIEENVSALDITDRINTAASVFNSSLNAPNRRGRKSKRIPVKTVGEAFENIPAKFWKTKGNTLVKTKTPVLLVKTDNNLK